MCRRVILDLHEFFLFATPIDSVSIISSLEKMQIFDSRTENVMSCLIDALDDPTQSSAQNFTSTGYMLSSMRTTVMPSTNPNCARIRGKCLSTAA